MDEDAYRKGLNGGLYTGGDWDSYRQGVSTREWNERGRSAGASDSGSGWSAGDTWGGGTSTSSTSTSTGGSDGGSWRSLLLLGALVVAVPALVMGVLAAPVLKPAATALGRYRPFHWSRTLPAAIFGNMWYIGLTVVMFLSLDTYVRHGAWYVLNGPDLGGVTVVLHQWLAAAWWSGLKLLEWSQHWGGPAVLVAISGRAQVPPLAVPLAIMAVAVVTLHLPGLLGYAIVLRRAGAVQDTPRGVVLALGLAALLVSISLPLATWLAIAIYTALM